MTHDSDRAGRGRPDPPADRASAEPARDARARSVPAGGRGRDRRMLGRWRWPATGPSVLALTRQNLPPMRTKAASENLCARGAYRLQRADAGAQGHPHRHRLRSRNRVRARPRLEARGIGADVVSMPCTDAVRRAGRGVSRGHPARRLATARSCACRSRPARPSAGSATRACHGLRIGIDRFGASAPARTPIRTFRPDADAIVRAGARPFEAKGNAMTKVAINGFGRIGRLVARAILERPDCGLELVAINDLADAKSNAWLFSRDSVHGRFPGEVSADGNDLVVDGKRIHVTAERDPAKLPHGQWRRHRAGMHRLLHRPRRRAEASRRRRQAGADLGPGQGRRSDRRLRRQRRQVDRRPPHRLQRLAAPPTAWRRSPRC